MIDICHYINFDLVSIHLAFLELLQFAETTLTKTICNAINVKT